MTLGTPRLTLALLLTVWSATETVVHAQASEPPSATVAPGLTTNVSVIITPDSAGALVHEEFVHASDSLQQRPRFRALTRACATIEDVQLTEGDRRRSLTAGAPGPWVTFDDFGERGADSPTRARATTLTLQYRVRHQGALMDVPLILPAHAIPRVEGEREGTVHVRVEGFPSGNEVRFPQLVHDATANTWSARFVAIPSFVRLTTKDTVGECTAPVGHGDDGGLSWRFWLLVGILVAWVPLYLAWAQRVTSADA